MAAGEHFDREIDFENLDPEQMTLIGPLCLFVSEQLTQPRWRDGATGSSPPFG